jgi:arsenite/tail-anchored protein-transporting ATPase
VSAGGPGRARRPQEPPPPPPPRLILYVGKGGVGKTTIAAATAVRAATRGHRTLVVSTEIAHSLGDVLEMPLTAEPRPVALPGEAGPPGSPAGPRPGTAERLRGVCPPPAGALYAQEINVLEEARRSWGRVQAQLSEFLRREGLSEIQADELAIVPGMEEVAALVQIGRQSREGDFDCIVVDAAPTGETIRLLSMPESFQWYAGRIEAWRGRLLRFVGPLFRGALPDLDVVDVMTHLAGRVRELRQLLTDPSRSSYRLVVTPDRLVLKEAQRAETYLNLFEYPIDAVVLNRLLPAEAAASDYLRALLARQEEGVAAVHRTFGALPILEAPLLAEEPLGPEALDDLARRVFGDRDPAAVLHRGPTQRIEREGEGYVLSIPMPNVEVERLSLLKRGDELYVEVGNVRREIALPRALAAQEPGTARIAGGQLRIPFRPQPAGHRE